jgi:hypothetical protein
MTSIIKVNNLQNQCGANTINKCGTAITVGASGDTVTLAAGASQSGFGQTYSAVSWDTTPKTGLFTAVSGVGYFCNTTSAPFTVTLPAGTAGDIVAFADYAATWQTNAVTVSPNGSEKIGSVNADAVLSTEGQSVTFVYVDATQGWINTMDSTSNVRGQPPFICASVSGACNTLVTAPDCANMKVATFTGPGTFTVNRVATCAADNVVSHVVVAGGGGSGTAGAGGGGAGGYREVVSPSSPYTGSPLNGYPSAPNRITVTAAAFPITVGGGGAGLPVPTPIPGAGGARGSSAIFSTITSTGGGGSPSQTEAITPTAPGGSGAGIGKSGTGPAGAGNTPPVSPAQGTNGGGNGPVVGGGGGGAGGAGTAGNPAIGGAGTTSSINGTLTARAGGGGGGSDSTCFSGGPAHPGGGGGGQGGNRPDTNSTNGTSNTGGGAGGTGEAATPGTQRNGGSGIVIIRYKFQ